MNYATDFNDLLTCNASFVPVSNASIKLNPKGDTISVSELPEYISTRQASTRQGKLLSEFVKLCKANNVLDEAFTKLNLSFIEYNGIKDFVDSKLCAPAGHSLFYYKVLMDLGVDLINDEDNYNSLKIMDRLAGFGSSR